MENRKSIFDDMESFDSVPDYLKDSLLSEVNNIRDTMQIVNHFTEIFISSALSLISEAVDDAEMNE